MSYIRNQFSSVQSLSHVRLFATPWIRARQASLSITISQSSLRLMSIESVRPSSHLILGRPLLLLPPNSPSIRVFSSESTLRMRWPKYWSFSFSIIPSKEIPELISFRMDWLNLLAVQGTLKSLLQHHSSKRIISYFIVVKIFPLDVFWKWYCFSFLIEWPETDVLCGMWTAFHFFFFPFHGHQWNQCNILSSLFTYIQVYVYKHADLFPSSLVPRSLSASLYNSDYFS